MRILVLGASGMLGHTLVHQLSSIFPDWKIYGTVRSESSYKFINEKISKNFISGVNVENIDSLLQVFYFIRPTIVINCIGLVKQLADSDDPLLALPINSILPHRLAKLCQLTGSKFIHISTDCVFSGEKGAYLETDFSDAKDLYGKSKFLGEVNYPNAITLRTSIIGHELQSKNGLVEWFLAQEKTCYGFTKAIFSGVPTIILAEIIGKVVIPNLHKLNGLYQIAAEPITKFDLLNLIAQVYEKKIEIIPNGELEIDRSLDATLFFNETGYITPGWNNMIKKMHTFRIAKNNV